MKNCSVSDPNMTFSSKLWEQINPLYQAIVTHPFNVELGKGVLDINKFMFYIKQDAVYLASFSRSLALIAGRSRRSETIQHFLNFSLGAIITERNLQTRYIKPLEIIEPSPACLGYTQFLLATAAAGSLEEAIAAVLPCFWIYREVGQWIAGFSERDNPYVDWIDTYSSPEFSIGVDQALALLNEVADTASPSEVKRMEKAFEYATIFEWHFWDDAYHMREFPNLLGLKQHEDLNVIDLRVDASI